MSTAARSHASPCGSEPRNPSPGAAAAPARRTDELFEYPMVGALLSEAPAALEDEARLRQAAHLARQTPIYMVGNIGNALITSIVLWNLLPHGPILLWFGLVSVLSAIRLQQWWRWREAPLPHRVSRTQLMRGATWPLVIGVLWGGFVGYAFPDNSVPHQLFLTFVVGGMAAGAVASMSLHPIACVAYAVPATLPLLIRFALSSSPLSWAIAIMLALYLTLLALALVNGYGSFLDTVRTRMENQSLATGLAEAALANRAKSEFLANMSHELRTPLNAILGFSEMISGEILGPVGNDRYRDYALDIYNSGRHLLRIINDVLDMSKIGAGRLELHEGSVNVAATVQASIALIMPRALAAGVTLGTELPENLPTLYADEVRVKQVLLNLLSNAVKFTHRSGSATVRATLRADGSLTISVADTGIGMTEAEISIAMEPFRQVDSELARKYEGTGLGLPLARALIELHGGRLEMRSAPGRGTTATIVFPPERVQGRPIPAIRTVPAK